jgi:hypothetical protein
VRRVAFGLMFYAVAAPAIAQMPTAGQLTPDQKGYIAYDQCMMHAAIGASHTDAKDEEIFGMAKSQCASTRSAVIIGQEKNREFLAALDAADGDKSANFPAWIKGVRERRKTFEVQGTAPAAAPRQ